MIHLPNLKQLGREDIEEILKRARQIKADPATYHRLLSNHSLAMLFQKTSTRTRVSFEAGMTELGGHAIFIDWQSSNFVLTDIEYEIEYLSRNVSCIMARLLHHSDLLKIISASQVPVINGCCEKFHPCQALTDILSMSEHFDGDLTEAHLAYVGVQNNVSNSLAIICDKLGIPLTLATPEQDDNGESLDADVQSIASASASVQHTTDPAAAVRNASFVYTDTWIDMQYFNNPDHDAENQAKLKQMLPYQINAELLQDVDCRIMHDMPIHNGFEISRDMVNDPRSIIYQQAANRMHAQKGLLWWVFEQAGMELHF
jgi:ornithine carbamoyltransferase